MFEVQHIETYREATEEEVHDVALLHKPRISESNVRTPRYWKRKLNTAT
jgi:hypothetical protein